MHNLHIQLFSLTKQTASSKVILFSRDSGPLNTRDREINKLHNKEMHIVSWQAVIIMIYYESKDVNYKISQTSYLNLKYRP